MHLRRSLKNLIAWIVCCTMLVGLATPMAVMAQPANAIGGWVDICSASKADAVFPDKSKLPDAGMLQHCTACSVHVAVLGFPPAPLSVLPLVLGTVQLPPLFLHAPRIPHAWVTAQPRAPPQFS